MAKQTGRYSPEQLRLKITLEGSKPKIWRRVEVNSGLTLHDLHFVIQNVFDWTNSHLYHFIVPPGGKLTRQAMYDAMRYSVMPPEAGLEGFESEDLPADEVMVGGIFTPDCKQIVYEYDFGDSWNHVVRLEKRLPDGDADAIPQCLAGENAAPVEDSGGIWGYYGQLEALKDPSSDEHERAVNWLGEDFDPARFDLDLVNKRLAAAFQPPPKRSNTLRKK